MAGGAFPALSAVDAGELPVYPFDSSDRLDSHYFMPWERRRWLNSDMRLKGTPECRALYFDLVCISYDQAPLGTLPRDMAVLSRLLMIERSHFEALCGLPYGPLHKWQPCLCGDEVRLYHPFVLARLGEAISRKEDNRARSEASSHQRALLRLREALAGYDPRLAENDAAVRWIDSWLVRQGCKYRKPEWIERGLQAWADHMIDLGKRRAR